MHPPESSIRRSMQSCPVSRRAALSFVALSITSVTSAQTPRQPNSPLSRSFQHGQLQIDLQYADAKAASFDPELRKCVTRALDAYGAILGGPPRDASDRPARRLRFEIRYGRAVSGEAGSGLVQLTLSDQKVFGQEVWPVIVLHEVFHLWNPESFRYRTREEEWFNEGITELYALRTAVQIGLISRDQVAVRFAVPIACYHSCPN